MVKFIYTLPLFALTDARPAWQNTFMADVHLPMFDARKIERPRPAPQIRLPSAQNAPWSSNFRTLETPKLNNLIAVARPPAVSEKFDGQWQFQQVAPVIINKEVEYVQEGVIEKAVESQEIDNSVAVAAPPAVDSELTEQIQSEEIAPVTFEKIETEPVQNEVIEASEETQEIDISLAEAEPPVVDEQLTEKLESNQIAPVIIEKIEAEPIQNEEPEIPEEIQEQNAPLIVEEPLEIETLLPLDIVQNTLDSFIENLDNQPNPLSTPIDNTFTDTVEEKLVEAEIVIDDAITSFASSENLQEIKSQIQPQETGHIENLVKAPVDSFIEDISKILDLNIGQVGEIKAVEEEVIENVLEEELANVDEEIEMIIEEATDEIVSQE